MTQESFSSKTKNILSEISPKKGCCKSTDKKLRSALEPTPDFAQAQKVGDRMLCDECVAVFLRIIFIKWGTVSDPSKSYHLEMSFESESFRDYVAEVLTRHVSPPKRSMRRNKYTLYYKNSSSIEDFLAFTGASSIAFDLINLKLMKEMRSNINRVNNFDTANMQKSVNANAVYLNAIRYLSENGLFSSLPDELRTTARLRIENDSLSMSQLAQLHSESITKSGVKHRLDKILAFAERAKKKGSN